MLHHLLFESLQDFFYPRGGRAHRSLRVGVHKPLTSLFGSQVRTASIGLGVASSVQRQKRILHPEVRLACAELMDMLCLQLAIKPCTASYKKLEQLHWTFGQKMITKDGTIYWATETQYATTHQKGGPRRDCVLLHGTEEVKNSDGDKVHTALCCQCVCFIRLKNLETLLAKAVVLPPHLRADVVDDTLTLILVRWFTPHPTATERCSSFLPLCPPPFHYNHALWQYAQSDRNRPILMDEDGNPTAAYRTQKHMFGKSPLQQAKRLLAECKAYYSLVQQSSIQYTM